MRRSTAMVAIVAFVAACASPPDEKAPGESKSSEEQPDESRWKHWQRRASTQFTAVEEGYDGRFEFEPGRHHRRDVDAHSALRVVFRDDREVGRDAMSPEWARLEALVDELGSAMRMNREIAEKVAPLVDNREAAEALSREAAAFNREAFARLKRLDALGVTTEDILAAEAATGLPPGPERAYRSLITLIEQRIAKQRSEVDALVADSKNEVSVQALVFSPGTEPRAVHVDGYDTIEAGAYDPIPRFGLALSATEQRKVNMQFGQAKELAGKLRTLQGDSGERRTAAKKALTDLRDQLAAFVATLRERPGSWFDQARAIAAKVAEEAAELPTPPPQAAAIVAELDRFDAEFDRLQALIERAEQIRAKVESSGYAALLAELFTDAGALADFVQDGAALLRTIAEEWPTRVSALRDAVAALPAELLSDANRTALLPDPIKDFIASTKEKYPDHVVIAVKFIALARSRVTDASIEGALARVESQLEWRREGDLPDAVVELSTAGLTLDDDLRLLVRFRDGDEEPLEPATYHARAELFGLHRRIGAGLIFARASVGSDEAQRWQPNAAVMAEWHYRIRDPGSGGGAWNLLDPGIGFHMASLDAGDDSVEVGLGMNASLGGGFIGGGAGFNLSSDGDRLYFFVGTDLIRLFQSLGGALSPSR